MFLCSTPGMSEVTNKKTSNEMMGITRVSLSSSLLRKRSLMVWMSSRWPPTCETHTLICWTRYCSSELPYGKAQSQTSAALLLQTLILAAATESAEEIIFSKTGSAGLALEAVVTAATVSGDYFPSFLAIGRWPNGFCPHFCPSVPRSVCPSHLQLIHPPKRWLVQALHACILNNFGSDFPHA